jgi:nicotinamidase-related amidase
VSAPIIDPSSVGIILIDAQPFFWESMHAAREPVLVRIERLLMLADWLELPLIATFEHPVETKGWLPERLERIFPSHGQRFVKRTFNCCSDDSIRKAIGRLGIKQVVVAGAETDVCVLQSSLGLLRTGLQVFILEDCIFTSEQHPRPALERMYRAGVVPCTLKAFFYELMRTVDRDALPAEWKARAGSFGEYFDLEALPPWDPAD